ncbi:MAG: hypothetical protein ACKOBW_12345 [Planctomycetota bacterium]
MSDEHKPTENDAAARRSRVWARWSILAAMICLMSNFLANRITGRFGVDRWGWLTWLVSWTTMLMVVVGLLLGLAALVTGARQLTAARQPSPSPLHDQRSATERATDTIGMALIGFTLNLMIVLSVIYFRNLLATSGG